MFGTYNENFNSIKVRLEPGITAANVRSIEAFQFHKGTIRTAAVAALMFHQKDFNSIKVRLELLTRF